MASPKQLLKRALNAGLYESGLLQLLLRNRTVGRAVVLTYHRVLPAQARAATFSADGIIVSPESFRRQMILLREHLLPMTMTDFSAAMAAGAFPRGACLVTFDDGWRDNLSHALPVLRETQVPATLFVATDYIGGVRVFWQETLARAIFELVRAGRGEAALEKIGGGHLRGLTDQLARLWIRRFVTSLKARPQPEIDAMVMQFREEWAATGIHTPADHPDRFLTWSELRDMQASGWFSVGSHCTSHTPLTKLDAARVQAELSESRAAIERQLGSCPDFLAYPNGDANPAIAEAAMAAGYATAFTTENGYVSPSDPRCLLRRINVHEFSTDSDAAFMARLARVF